jgi:hypothetical protein
MVAVAAMFGCFTVDDRQLRRLVGVTERLHTLHLHSILREGSSKVISLTNVASERAFAVSKDTFKSKYNSNKLLALFCCRINSTLSFFTDNDEILKEALKGITSDEKRHSDARKSAHETSGLRVKFRSAMHTSEKSCF